jgi:hypothetical protein
MGPSDEMLELLRQIRDDQRELLALSRARVEEYERRYRQWQEERAEAKALAARHQEMAARWDEVNSLWLKQNRRGRQVAGILCAILLVAGLIVAALAMTGCFQ